MINPLHKERGFTLVETLVAISILVVAIVGPLTIAMRGLQSAFFAREQLTAVYLAQEGVEIIRMYRDQYSMVNVGTGSDNWMSSPARLTSLCALATGCGVDINALANAGIRNCATTNACRLRYNATAINSSSRGMYTHGGSAAYSPYTRVVTLQDVNGGSNSDEVIVTVKVSWNSGFFGGTKTVTLQDRIFSQYDDY